MASKTRSDGEGSVFQRHKPGCERPTNRTGRTTCGCPWQGVLVVGWRDKKPVRKKVTGGSQQSAKVKLRELRDAVEHGNLPKGRVLTVEEWLTYWLENIVAKHKRPSTHRTYRSYVHQHLIPLLGTHKLDRVTPEHLEAAWDYMTTVGRKTSAEPTPLSSTTAHQAHVILSRALRVAVMRGYCRSNVAALTDAPSIDTAKMVVLTKAQARKVVDAAQGHRNAARWTVAFTLGLRQGEALGLRWADVDLDEGIVRVQHSLGRVTGQGLKLGPVKSKKGERTQVMPAPLLAAMKAHRTAQNAERLAAGSRWRNLDFVFANHFGGPLDPKHDWETWRDLLAEAGVPHVRLHAARHSAITMALAMGVMPQVVQEWAGHARFATTEAYIDRVDDLHVDAAQKMAAFWD